MDLSRFESAEHKRVLCITLFLLALALRMGVLLFTIDVPGDGPTHATATYQMFLYPILYSHGTWLPGYNYLMFGFYYLLGDPVLTPRIVNVVLGSLTVPLFWYLIGTSFDYFTALLSSLLLILLPLHIGLSASSLTESSFVFEFVAGSVLLILAARQDPYRLLYLFLAAFFLFLAVMTRYEAWLLVPLFPGYYYLKTHRLSETTALAIILLIYPVIWSIDNYFFYGDAFRGFTTGKGWYHGATPADWLYAIGLLVYKSNRHLGSIVIAAMTVGFVLECIELFRRKSSLENIFYFAATFVTAAAVYRLAMLRGTALWDRYLLFGLVLMLPFAVLPIIRLLRPREIRWSVPAAASLVFLSVVYHPHLYKSLRNSSNDLYVTRWRPVDIIDVASWIKNGSYRNHAVLLTENGGESWYFANYFPAEALRHCVVAWYSPDSLIDDDCFNIGARMNLGDNYLFITSGRDRGVRGRIEKSLGASIPEDELVYSAGDLRVYDISPLLKAYESKRKANDANGHGARETHDL